ncbi:dipeptidase E [Polaribacter sejongensis]|uniref:Dipeptidase E n=1 Tax=Polaribacter sejongensis TaxID=985043 RepID=A0ABN5F6G0_9FLAO|nr:dipeptidase PepE [Polaribacter sejongensis]AUC22643.1 dipeptidase E [Polaribacter sejongensis]
MKKMIIASTSTVHGSSYLEYLLPTLKTHFNGVKQLLFIPYARPSGISYDDYTTTAKNAFSTINIDVKGIHEFENAKEAIQDSEGIFTGGGNTFELVNQLYKNDVLSTLKQVLDNGTPYLGTSAGSNICGLNMKNTNDMPIVYPPSFTTLGCIPFNINAHYLDPIEGSTHMGETRETRIKEFHVFNEAAVLGLREGSWLEVVDEAVFLRGKLTARLFEQNKQPIELKSGGLIEF